MGLAFSTHRAERSKRMPFAKRCDDGIMVAGRRTLCQDETL